MRLCKYLLQNNLKLLENIFIKTQKSEYFLRNQFCSFSKMVEGIEAGENFKRLPPPTKGLCDKYEYSVIQLKNGLTALLISDVENLISIDPAQTALDQTVESEEESGNESGSESDSEMEVDESMENGKRSDEKLAALALTIGAGSFCDGDIPGLAHFLEHMVFMGSGKYPQENDFDAFLSSRGGSSNASTEYEYTTFYFDIPEPHLKQSMDIFSNFFIDPLLNKDSVRSEMEIVDSEFQSSILNDTARLEQLLATNCSLDNPARKFVWGNLESLRDSVDESVLYAELRNLRRDHYVADHMTVALQARLDLATLEAWVVEHFSAIPSNSSSKPRFTSDPPFLMDQWHRFYTVKPVDDLNELHLNWFLPPVQHLYRSKPLDFLSWYIGHEGPGSVMAYLRDKKLLATEIEAGYESSGFHYNHLYTLFKIEITLSDEGVGEIKHILDVIFQYLSLLSTSPLSEDMYKEIAQIHRIGFDYKSESSSIDYVELVSNNMQCYPSEEYLTGGALFKQYNQSEIRHFLSLMSPERLNVSLVSKIATTGDSVVLDQTERWFKTQYRVDPINPAWTVEWQNPQVPSYLYLPSRNEFITTEFSLLPVTEEAKYPAKIMQTEAVEVWFKQTVKYKLPRCIVNFVLETPCINQSPEDSVLCDLFLNAIDVTLSATIYNPYLAQYYVHIARGEYGIHLSFNGFSQHMEPFLTIVLNHLAKLEISEELFSMSKDTLLRRYINNLKDTEVLRRALRMGILCQDAFMIEDKYRVLRDRVKYQDLLDFRDTLFKRMYVKCLAMGNISESSILSLISSLSTHLPHSPLDASERREIRISRLERREKILRVKSLNSDDPNCAVLNYYQSCQNDGSLREACVLEILVDIISEPLFDTLRTKSKLGYTVNATVRDTFGVLGLSILVESQMKYSVDFVEDKIHGFVSRYVQDNVDTIREKYGDIIATLVKKKKMVDVNLKEEVDRHFAEIKVQDYLFDRQERELELIQTIELAEIVTWIEKNIVDNPKKLSVQIVGTLDEKAAILTDSMKTEPVRSDHKRKHSDTNVPDSGKLLAKVGKGGGSNSVDNQTASVHVTSSVNGSIAENSVREVDNSVHAENSVQGSTNNTVHEPENSVRELAYNSLTNDIAWNADVKRSDQPKVPSNSTKSPVKTPSISGSFVKDSFSMDPKETNKLTDLALEYLIPNETDSRFITDIKTYRQTLEQYPVLKLK